MTPIICLLLFQSISDVPPLWDLLTKSSVQHELHLSPAQTQTIDQIMKAADSELERRLKEKKEITARAISREGMLMEIALPHLQDVGESLSEDQKARAREISVQQLGPRLLFYTGITGYVDINPENRQRIETAQSKVADKYREKIDAYARQNHVPMVNMKGGYQMPEETPAIIKMEKARDEEMWVALRKRLSSDQNARLNRLLGKPFSG